MAGGSSFVSLALRRSSGAGSQRQRNASHYNSNINSNSNSNSSTNSNNSLDYSHQHYRQPSPSSQHHATSPGLRPVSPLESESDAASARLSRSVSMATTKSALVPIVAVHPAIAEETPPGTEYGQHYSQQQQQQHGQSQLYKSHDRGAVGSPYGDDDTQYYGYRGEQQQQQQQQQQQYRQQYGHPEGATYNASYNGSSEGAPAYQSQPPPPGQPAPFDKTNDHGNNRRTYRIFSEWMWELITLVLTFLLLWAIGILLATYNSRPVPDWGRYINLNTLLALLSTLFRAGLVVVITSVISQRKWSWFAATEDHHHARLHSSSRSSSKTKPRSLGYIQKYDEGSRNSFKAMWLFGGVLGGRDMIALSSALVFLLSFLVGPFVQQSSQTLSCSTLEQSSGNGTAGATIPIARFVPRAGGWVRGYGGNPGNPTSETIVAMLSSATAPKGVENQVGFTCSTGNCTFSDGDPSLGAPGPGAITEDSTRQNTRRDSPSEDALLPFLAHPVDAHGVANADFLSITHSTVGICHLCSDISSAVTQLPPDVGQGAPSGTLLNMTISANSFATVLNMTSTWVNPDTNSYTTLDWLEAQNLVSPAQGRAAKYALQNTTLLMMTDTSGKGDPNVPSTIAPNTYLAATCNMYPCLRTFSSAVEGGQLREVETADSANQQNDPLLRAERQMWPAMMANLSDTGLPYLSMAQASSMWLGYGVMLAAIKSPCRVTVNSSAEDPSAPPATAVYTRQNMSLAPSALDMIMYQPRMLDSTLHPVAVAPDNTNITKEPDYHWAQYRVPEECIYRHSYNFQMAVSEVLQNSILTGSCSMDPRQGPLCSSPIAGGDQALQDLFKLGLGSMQTVNTWFSDFGDAITARYRFQFGAGNWNASELVVLTTGTVNGQVWLSGVCIAAEMKWLAFPAILLVLTAVLLGWTVWGNWKLRQERPVWKDNLLPLLFYYGRFREQDASGQHGLDYNGGLAGEQCKGEYQLQRGGALEAAQQGKLLEVKEMQEIANRTMVTFDWPASTARERSVEDGRGMGTGTGALYDEHGYGGNAADQATQDEEDVPRPRRPLFRMPWHQRLSVDSLLDQDAQR